MAIYKSSKELKIDLDSDVSIFEQLNSENIKNNTNVSDMELLEAMEKFGLAKKVI